MAQPAARPQPYLKSDKYKFLGMYGETPDMSGGFGQAGVDAFEKFLEGGGTLITTLRRGALPDRVRLRAHRSTRRASTGRQRAEAAGAGRDREDGSPGVLRLRGEDHSR